ncbi:MAG: DUF4174 domain-containing protein [Oceanipulchritudo sp.]
MANPLDSFRWDNRLLLIHVESPEEARAVIGEFEAAAGEVDDRDLLWFIADPEDLHTNKPESLEDSLRDRIHDLVSAQELPDERVRLIGKDGGIKGRYERLDLPAVFARIDSMPMRRAEMGK